jgi:protein involved in sex pheromone biosynthesis
MKAVKFLALLLAVVFVTSSCGKKSEAEATAAKFCKCGAPMLEMKKKMDTASDEEKMALAGEAMKAAGEMMECMGGEEALKKLEEGKTEEQKKKFEEDMKAAMEKQCPELAKEMGM